MQYFNDFKQSKTLLFFVVGYILLFLYQRHLSFIDESDNILGALLINDGKDIYSGFISQHTPFVYYFISIFASLGVRDYESFRVCMSLSILAAWVFLYYRYHRVVGKNVFRVFVLMYALTISVHWGNMILSDVFEGYALLCLFLELIKYNANKTLKIDSMIVISISTFISLMSAFVSIYPLCVLFLVFFSLEIKLNSNSKIKKRIKDYLNLVLIMSIPFLILISWYAITGNLNNFYFEAYQFNRIFYSKYLGGFGDDALTIFNQVPITWIGHISVNLLSFNKDSMISMTLIIFNVVYLVGLYKKSKLLSIGIFIFIGFTGVRGYTNFHAIPYYIISFFCASYVIDKLLITKIENIESYKRFALQVLTFLFFLYSFNSYLPNAGINFLKPKGTMVASAYDSYIEKLTAYSDPIWVSNLYPQSYIKNHRRPATKSYTLVPWYADAYTNQVIDELSHSRPKLIIFEKDSDVWGHKYSDFANKIFDYIKVNYICLNMDDSTEKNIYIRYDFYSQASLLLWQMPSDIRDGMLISDSSSTYLIENGTKRHIANPDVFSKRGYNWSDVKKYDDLSVKKIKTGKTIE